MKYWVLIASVLMQTIHANAQESGCDARPRWLAVTVVSGRTIGLGDRTVQASAGVQLVDRCEDTRLTFVSELDPISYSGDGAEAFAQGAKSRLHFYHIPPDGDLIFRVLFVRETVQQLCAAMDDCGDATIR